MGWVSKLFSKFGGNIIEASGKVLDDLVTSDEEMALTDIQKLKIKTAYEVEMKRLVNDLDTAQKGYEVDLEKELTTRLKHDMSSDSWLSKNIRPCVVGFLTLAVVAMSAGTVFDSGLTPSQQEALKEWIPFYTTLMVTVYGFYFGSRGIEKVKKL